MAESSVIKKMEKFVFKKIVYLIIILGIILFGFWFGYKWFFKKTPSKEQEIAQIKEVTKKSLDAILEKEFGKDYEIKKIDFYDEERWAVAHLIPITFETDEALVVYKKEKNDWKVFLGPGTFFGDADLEALNQLPSEVKKEIGVEE